MIEKISGLTIKGRCFSEETNLRFFSTSEHRISIIYGRNGSGKSTISQGFSYITSNSFPEDFFASLTDETNSPLMLTDEGKVFVFNENYIDENVKIDDDGLGTIVLFGGQINLQGEIDRYQSLETYARTSYETAQSNFEYYSQPNNPLCPEYHWQQIKENLRREWAVRDGSIKGNKTNSSVTDKLAEEICILRVDETITQLQEEYRDIEELLRKVSDSSLSFPDKIETIQFITGFEDKLCDLLNKKIDEPVLTEREKLILEAVQHGRQAVVESAQGEFSKAETEFCPYCYQPITAQYKRELLTSINRVLNKDVDIHKKDLGNVVFPDINRNYSEYTALNREITDKISHIQSECNDIIEKYRLAICAKTSNIYNPVHTVNHGLEKKIIEFNEVLCTLENNRIAFLEAGKQRKELVQKLIDINKKIAHIHIESIYKNYLKQRHDKQLAEQVTKEKYDKLNEIKNHLFQLELQKKNVNLAINNINNALDYIFFSRERLSIVLKDDKYYLRVNGKDVKPRSISLGERNIIALCYFFTQVLANQDIDKLYEKEELLVIDDPVSSFDFENKVGIISYIRYQINKVVRGNAKSKVLLLSHDLTTIFDLHKAMEEICQSIKQDSLISNVKFEKYELRNYRLTTIGKTLNEYGSLINTIYRYAKGCNDENLVIGNIMRRTLEVFSTFNYRKSINDVLIDNSVLTALNNHSVYFENLMCRLVLHGESHFEEQVYSLHDDTNFYQFVSDTEKRRTAKDILCFMYILNKPHVEAYLGKNAIIDITCWKNAIPENTSFEIIPSGKKIPLYELSLSAGTGNPIFEDVQPEGDYEVENTECDIAVRVQGDSMEPTVPNRSIVLIKKCAVEDNDIGAFYLNGEVYCKRLIYEGNKTYLKSENPEYAPIEILEGDILESYGKVIEIISTEE